MKRLYETGLVAACVWGAVLIPYSVRAVTRYVDQYSFSPVEPFTDPNHGASTLQAAVDVCWPGDEVLVYPGEYAQGGRAVEGQQVTNRLVLTNSVTVRAMDGAEVTHIVGQIPVGDSGIRGVYLSPGSQLIGFTVTRGSTRTGEGGWSPDCSGGGIFMEGGGIVSNCTVFTNTASFGGGIFCAGGEVANCRILTNMAVYAPGSGAGVYCAPSGRIRQCTIQGNRGMYGGGGFCDEGGVMEDCLIRQNRSSRNAGGLFCASNSLVKNCQISGNYASYYGGGAYSWRGGEIRNVLLLTNTAVQWGGGSFLDRGGQLRSCTVSRNSGNIAGGGVYTWSTGEVWNTIIYQNSSSYGSNYAAIGSGPFFGYSCLAPLPSTNLTACFANNPSFERQGSYRLNANSPCLDKGTNQSWMLLALDNDLRPRIWIDRVDVGALERNPANMLEDTDNDGIPDYWEWQYFGHVTGLLPSFDGDGDLYDAYSEFIAGTDPTSASSFFAVSNTRKLQGNNVLTWPSVAGRFYTLFRTTNLMSQAGNVLLAVDMPATPPFNSYTDTVMNAQSGIYILHVRKP